MKAKFENFELESRYLGNKRNDRYRNPYENSFKHKITITNEIGQITFDYWGTCIINKRTLLLEFYRILIDASYIEYFPTFESFYNESKTNDESEDENKDKDSRLRSYLLREDCLKKLRKIYKDDISILLKKLHAIVC